MQMINKAGNMIRLVCILALFMFLQTNFNRSGFCGSFASSRWSDTSLVFKASSTRFTRPGKSWELSSSSSALSFSCSPASSTPLNKTVQTHMNGETKNCSNLNLSKKKASKHYFCRKFYDCILWSALTVTTVGYTLQPEVGPYKNIYLIRCLSFSPPL